MEQENVPGERGNASKQRADSRHSNKSVPLLRCARGPAHVPELE